MKRLIFALLLMLPTIAWAQLPTCSQTCATQTFATDPLATGETFTYFTNTGGCPWEWNSTLQGAGHVPASANCNLVSYLKYRGNIAVNGCVSAQAVSTEDGSLAGLVMRADTTTSINQHHYAVLAVKGSTTMLLRAYKLYNQATGPALAFEPATPSSTCNTWTAINNGDYIGACVRGVNDETVVNVFHLGATDPGPPLNTDGGDGPGGGAGWGVAECSFTNFVCNGAGTPVCPNSGNSYGVYSSNLTAGPAVFDNLRTYSCM